MIYSFTKFFLFQTNNFSFWRFLFTFIYYILLIIMIYFYIQTIVIKPGFVIKDWEKEDFLNEINLTENNSNPMPSEIKKTYCKICEFERPERAHHCKVCGKCVMKMFHHCYWTYNCIGHQNQKFYYLFLFYSMILNFFNFLCLLYSLCNSKVEFSFLLNLKEKFNLLKHIIFPLTFILSIIFNLAIFFVFAFLFVRETILLLNNCTSNY